jgi:hypothetical protein
MNMRTAMTPGTIVATNRSMTDCCTTAAYTRRKIDGGMRLPSAPPPVSVPSVSESL